MRKAKEITTRATIAPGVYRLKTGVYEVWHRGRYVARTDSEAEALEIKASAKKMQRTDSGMTLMDNVEEARKMHRSTKRRQAVIRQIQTTKYTRKNRPRPTTNGRQLIDEQPDAFSPKKMVEYLQNHDWQMPQTVEEWESGSDDSTFCSLKTFAFSGMQKLVDDLVKAAKEKVIEASEVTLLIEVETLEKYAEKLRDSWIEKYIEAINFVVSGWNIENDQRCRDLNLAKKLMDKIKEYYEGDEETYAKLFEG